MAPVASTYEERRETQAVLDLPGYLVAGVGAGSVNSLRAAGSGLSHSNTIAYPNEHTHTNADTHTDPDTHTDGDTDAHSDTHSHTAPHPRRDAEPRRRGRTRPLYRRGARGWLCIDPRV